MAPEGVNRAPPSKTAPSTPAQVIRISNNVAYLGSSKAGPKPPQLLQLPPFPAAFTASKPLPGRKRPPRAPLGKSARITAVTWLKYYFADVLPSIIQGHFNKGQVLMEWSINNTVERNVLMPSMKKVEANNTMTSGTRLYIPVSVVDSKISTRYTTIPSATSHPNADEIDYIRRLVVYKDSAILLLNKPPKLPVKGNLPVQESMDTLARAALSYGNEDGPKLVHRLDRESSGLLVMARTQDSFSVLTRLFSDVKTAKTSSQIWNEACEATIQKYWALVIGSPKKKEGRISSPLSKVFLKDSKTERVVIAHPSGLDGCQEAVTEYRVMGPAICGCYWLELRPLTCVNHQLRVHCAEALGTPIVGDYYYGWYAHQRWAQSSRTNYDPHSKELYRLKRPEGLQIQKGSVLSKVPLLHLHCRELVIPNIEKFSGGATERQENHCQTDEKSDLLHLVAPMPTHMKISWSVMSNYLE